MKIHIGMVIKSMNVGGIERCIARLANGMDRQRFRVSVICLDHSGPAADWISNPDVEIVELRYKSGNNWKLIRELARQFKNLEDGIVQSHNWATLVESHLAAHWAGRLIHSHAERGTVLGGHASGVFRQRLRAAIMRFFIARAHARVSNAYAVADRVRSTTGLTNLPIDVIPNGVAVPYNEAETKQHRHALRAALQIDESDILVGTVGRLVPVKNLALAIQGFADARQKVATKLRLILVGDGPSKDELRQLASQLNVSDSVLFVGEKSNVWPYYAAMDLYINTSHSEGMSQSILEAMACGKPVLATDVGDSRRLIGGAYECGILLSEPTARCFSDSLTEILNNRSRLIHCGLNSRKNYEANYSLQSMLVGFENYYAQLWRKFARTEQVSRV